MASSSTALAQADPAQIIDEGLNRSQVMLTASDLMDGIGPRPPLPTNPFKYEYPKDR